MKLAIARHTLIPRVLENGSCLNLIIINKTIIGDAINKEIALAGFSISLNETKLKLKLKSKKNINDKVQIQTKTKPSILLKKTIPDSGSDIPLSKTSLFSFGPFIIHPL
ncbi:hypothetical protein [Aeromonas veronii]|uniref:hypothetical protein n=1 Tax=Aeromonas veronii TaxID=654 RepID=UPI001E446F43|nr:hypothetical protein [Aeromonas veronii]MCD6619971.1 hypothetical protein [Aeromonas veronii]